MNSRLLHIGFGNMVVRDRVISIICPSSAPIKRLKEEARQEGLLIDATQGRKTRSVLITDSKHVILSALQPETLAHRYDEEGALTAQHEERT
ncbi:MAG TPA: DUF370 domain-containing protein [Synergistaceae bacterium]|nr:DUF370 domain-containing protein [Synergistaceae bacterium]HPJ24630.1 DUF370 domain-containing protein [Synergistaceae bacterium]HPQ36175.1 DUF370 domain-containing protein [Synergistaceae bacterium]